MLGRAAHEIEGIELDAFVAKQRPAKVEENRLEGTRHWGAG